MIGHDEMKSLPREAQGRYVGGHTIMFNHGNKLPDELHLEILEWSPLKYWLWKTFAETLMIPIAWNKSLVRSNSLANEMLGIPAGMLFQVYRYSLLRNVYTMDVIEGVILRGDTKIENHSGRKFDLNHWNLCQTGNGARVQAENKSNIVGNVMDGVEAFDTRKIKEVMREFNLPQQSFAMFFDAVYILF
jgi:hypothetical protein